MNQIFQSAKPAGNEGFIWLCFHNLVNFELDLCLPELLHRVGVSNATSAALHNKLNEVVQNSINVLCSFA